MAKRWARSNSLTKLNELGSKNGVGTIDIIENRLVGMKSRGVYETPGGTILFAAHAGLEQLILDRDTTQYKGIVAQKFSELVYDGLWYTPLREAISAFVDVTQKEVTGTVKMKLYKGTAYVAARKSPYSLYSGRIRNIQQGRSIQPAGCRRIHQPLLPATQDPCYSETDC